MQSAARAQLAQILRRNSAAQFVGGESLGEFAGWVFDRAAYQPDIDHPARADARRGIKNWKSISRL
jgi:hypothetical protein